MNLPIPVGIATPDELGWTTAPGPVMTVPQAPSTQTPVQIVPQEPQLLRSVFVSTQAPKHLSGLGRAQASSLGVEEGVGGVGGEGRTIDDGPDTRGGVVEDAGGGVTTAREVDDGAGRRPTSDDGITTDVEEITDGVTEPPDVPSQPVTGSIARPSRQVHCLL